MTKPTTDAVISKPTVQRIKTGHLFKKRGGIIQREVGGGEKRTAEKKEGEREIKLR